MEQDQTPTRVWIVDDQASARRLMTEFVHAACPKLVAHEFSSAQDALEATATCTPNLVLVDYRMPGGDGVSFVRQLHEKLARTKPVPVIMVSAIHDASIREFALEAGVAEFIAKPIDIDVFTTVVRGFISEPKA